MPGRRPYVVDTNVYIDAIRTDAGRAGLGAFLTAFAPVVHMSAVVVQELRAGARGASAARLEAAFVAPFERRERLITPSYNAWKEAGRVLSELVAPDAWASVTRSFVNDVLLAVSCRESGAVLVTRNVADCERIAKVRRFDFVPPWPQP
jgi:predicted nucleic acid-binding protein